MPFSTAPSERVSARSGVFSGSQDPSALVIARVALPPAALHLLWQGMTLDAADGAGALARFRSNRFAGLLVAAACFVVGNA